jgi:hypothetical protein
MHAIERVDERMAAEPVFATRVWGLLAQVDPAFSVEIRRLRMRGEAA